MYVQQSLQDALFLLLYGGVATLAVMAGLYLLLRRSNGILPDINPPRVLRRWTAAFFLMTALSHLWWYVLGVYWLTDDRLVRNITAITLDHILLVPLAMAILLRLLQNRQHRIWPWALTQFPILVTAVIGIVRHDEFYGYNLTTYWQLAVMIAFVVYYIHSLIKYGRWLRENYADLEHKEVWQSLVFAAVLFVVYEIYFTNPGEMAKEYLAQIETLAIITFLLWRVETLQQLGVEEKQEMQVAPHNLPVRDEQQFLTEAGEQVRVGEPSFGTGSGSWTNETHNESYQDRHADSKQTVEQSTSLSHRERLRVLTLASEHVRASEQDSRGGLEKSLFLYCEQPKLYLRYNLTLSELAETIGTSREVLSAWFAGRNDTYNAYINRLRIDHFVRLYSEAAKAQRTFTIFELAHKCGYRSFLSFTSAFRQRMGTSVTAWLKKKSHNIQSETT